MQRVLRGEYKWSALLGSWVGSCRQAAKAVPARFLGPEAPIETAVTEVEAAQGPARGKGARGRAV